MTGHAWGGPGVTGRIRACPGDFRVEEILGHAPDGEGEHLWLWVEKTGLNTADAAGMLAGAAGVPVRDVGFAGLKDRQAVTRQWFSLPLAGRPEPALDPEPFAGLKILDRSRSGRKIQRGRLAGNRFELVVRDIRGERDATERTLAAVDDHGVPNGFGEQRFGGNNIARAYRLFRGQMRRKPNKSKRGFYLSAARSLIFNRVLEARIDDGTWNRLRPGDVAMLDGSRSFFPAEPDDPDLVRRCAEQDIHPTGPLVGSGELPVSGEVATLEQAVFDDHAELVTGLMRFGLEHQRRALRMRVRDLDWRWVGDDLEIAFALDSGGYATTVLREVVDYETGPGLPGEMARRNDALGT